MAKVTSSTTTSTTTATSTVDVDLPSSQDVITGSSSEDVPTPNINIIITEIESSKDKTPVKINHIEANEELDELFPEMEIVITEPPKISVITATSATEGVNKSLVYNISFDSVSTEDRSYAFSVGGDASFGEDYLTGANATISNGVINNGNGTITVPAGIQSFSVTVPIVDDQEQEGTETASIQIGTQVGIGQIFDDDTSTEAGEVELIQSNSVNEGDKKDLLFEITLNQTLTEDKTFKFSIGGNATFGKDYKTGDDVVLSNGVINNGNGTITVLAGTTNFTVSVPIIDDDIIEATETASIQIGEAKGIAQIFDNDGETKPLKIEKFIAASDVSEESEQSNQSNNAHFYIQLKEASTKGQELNISLSKSSQASNADVDLDNLVAYIPKEEKFTISQFRDESKDNGFSPDRYESIRLDNGQLILPEGVTEIALALPIIDDKEADSAELLELTAGNKSAKLKISDQDFKPVKVDPNNLIQNGHFLLNNDRQMIGNWTRAEELPGWDLKNNIEIWRSGFQGKEAVLGRYFIEMDSDRKVNELSQTVSTEIGAEYQLSFDHRRRQNKSEAIEVSINGEKRKETFDSGSTKAWKTQTTTFTADALSTVIALGEPEGENDSFGGLIDNVKLLKVSEGKTPIDNEEIKVTKIESNSVREGEKGADGRDLNLFYRVSLNQETKDEEGTRFDFTIGGDAIFGQDYLTGENVQFSDERIIVKSDKSGKGTEVIIPQGISQFTAYVPVVDDKIVEKTETAFITINDQKGNGYIFDNDVDYGSIQRISANEVTEGDKEDLRYEVLFSDALLGDTTFDFSVSGTADLGIDYESNKTDGSLTGRKLIYSDPDIVNHGNGSITVPGGTTRFFVDVPVFDDEIEELSETAILRVGTQVGIGVIHDNDAVEDLIEQKQPNAISIGTNTVKEGDSRNLRFTIILNDEVQKDNGLLLPYYISEDIDSDNVDVDDIILEKLSFTKGVEMITNENGQFFKVPKGVQSFSAVIPVFDDIIEEDEETLKLTVINEKKLINAGESLIPGNEVNNEISGIGRILDNDPITPTLTIADLEVEMIRTEDAKEGDGKDLIYEVVLNREAQNETFNFEVDGDATFGVDYKVGNNVTLTGGVINNGNGSITVDGVTSFIVSVPVIDDTEIENTETASLTVGDKTGISQIFDNDTPLDPNNPRINLIGSNSVTEGDGNQLIYDISFDIAHLKDTIYRFSIGGDATFGVDYKIGNDVTLSPGIVNNGDGTITVSEGIKSFYAAVPVIDDTLIESTETASISIGGVQGIGQIFDNDRLSSSTEVLKQDVFIDTIDANSVLEGDGKDLIYDIRLNRKNGNQKNLTYQFFVDGDAIFGVDYQIGNLVTLTDGVINNGDGSITIPGDVSRFQAIVPVIDDQLVEDTELASLQIGKAKGVGQIFDNDGLKADLDISVSEDGKKLLVDAETDTWLQYEVLQSDASWQNTLQIKNKNGESIGVIGATANSKNLGNHEFFVTSDDSFSFSQVSNQNVKILQPNYTISKQDDHFLLVLDDNAKDHDFNDLVVKITPSSYPIRQREDEIAGLQKNYNESILDFTNIKEEGLKFQMTISASGDQRNRVGLVKLEGDVLTGFEVDGLTSDDGTAFEDAIKNNLIDPGSNKIFVTKDQSRTSIWELDQSEEGYYAPVVINEDGNIFTWGTTSSTGNNSDAENEFDHVKNLGRNFFGFEDTMAKDQPDWDYNDVTFLVELF